MAIKVSNAYKRYGKGDLVLKNLNMEVGHGQIYGLLGASGCGKTTLFSCMVGLRQLDAGEIIIFGQERHGGLGYLCGYMPQESALLNALSIKEVLRYFGLIYGMTSQAVDRQISFLSTFLDLPPVSSPIQKLSGGQRRRVSLSVSLIHNPSLLVLDEPTVGLDPVLREKIWEYLFEISRVNGTTIIISTHYIEETKRCDKIGFMRGGQLLAEDDPTSLLCKFRTDSLENVALQLCRQDTPENIQNNNSIQDEEGIEIKSFRKRSPSIQNSCVDVIHPKVETHHLSIIYAIVKKSWHRHLRDWRLFLGEFGLPVLVICLLQNIVGRNPQNLKIGVVTNTNFSSEQCKLGVDLSSGCFENTGICDFLGKFEHNEFNWVAKRSYANAYEDIRQGDSMGLIEFPLGFSNFTKERILYRNFATNKTISGSTIAIRMDMQGLITSWASSVLAENYMKFVIAIGTACSGNGDIILPSLKFNAIYGTVDHGSWISFIQPGLVIILTFMLPSAICVVLIEDRRQMLEDRDYVAGIASWHHMMGTFLFHSILCISEMVVYLGLLCGVYGMEIKGSWILAVCLIFVSSVSALSIGFTIAAVRDGVVESVLFALFLTLTQAMCSGLFLPLEMAVAGFRIFAKALPATFMIEALRSITTRGWGISNYIVVRGFVIAFGYMLVCIIICMLVDRKRHK